MAVETTAEVPLAEPICTGAPILPPPHQSLLVGHDYIKVNGVWTCRNCPATT